MILAAIGANLPLPGHATPYDNVKAALEVLDANDITVTGVSSWYRSAPIPASNQPDFVNGVVSIRTSLSAQALLQRFHRIESEFGRRRSVENAARTLDIDLIDYDGVIVVPPNGQEGLTLPHPRLQDRAFVLFPLRDLAPDWVDPRDGRALDDLIEALLSDQFCVRIEE